MVLLAARLGLRIGDIRNLKLHDIDWTKKQISIIRHKTQKALLLPLPEEVGWAVIDYLKNGRPVTESPNVFPKIPGNKSPPKQCGDQCDIRNPRAQRSGYRREILCPA